MGVEPRLVVVPHGVDDERVSVPVANRMAPPGWNRVVWGRVLPAVHEDLPYCPAAALLSDDVNGSESLRSNRLDEIPGKGVASCDRDRSAEEVGLILLFAACLERLCPRE